MCDEYSSTFLNYDSELLAALKMFINSFNKMFIISFNSCLIRIYYTDLAAKMTNTA